MSNAEAAIRRAIELYRSAQAVEAISPAPSRTIATTVKVLTDAAGLLTDEALKLAREEGSILSPELIVELDQARGWRLRHGAAFEWRGRSVRS